jgi:flagellar basal-body rod protein FlgB
MIDKLGDALNFHGNALTLRARRQEALAANIANADTPGYQARDFDFSKALEAANAASGTNGGASLARSAPAHVATGTTGGPATPMLYRLPLQPSLDGNTVDMDTERMQFADNAVRYEAALRFLNGQIKTILSAIQG